MSNNAICNAPLYVAEDLLRVEGFTHVEYVKGDGGINDEKMIASGQADLIMGFAGRHILAIDRGDSVVNLKPSDISGSASGSATLFVQTAPRALRELLPGKSGQFIWKGRFYGDGLLDLTVQVSGDFPDSPGETTGLINCNRVVVGNGGEEPPTATPDVGEPSPTNTAAVNTPMPTFSNVR